MNENATKVETKFVINLTKSMQEDGGDRPGVKGHSGGSDQAEV